MLADLAQGAILRPAWPDPAAVEKLIRQRQPNYFSYADWLRLNELELSHGQKEGRTRLKFTRIEDMLAALGRG